MAFESAYKAGDRVTVVAENKDTESPYVAAHNVPINTTVTLKSYDKNDHTWLVDGVTNANWVSEYTFERPVDDSEVQDALRSIMSVVNPNIQVEPPPREIFNPDFCEPYTLITVGNPTNGRVCIKLPDIKHAAKNRWRDVGTGKLVEREDFRAGWDYYRQEVTT